MNNDKTNISKGLPKASGALYWAPAGTPLPTDATAALDAKYVNLGYVTEDGLTDTTAEDGDDVKAWGNEVVMHSQTGFTKTFKFNLLEVSRVAVLQFIYGKDNVTVAADKSVSWDETGEALPRGVLVVDTLYSNGTEPRFKRVVVGDAQFTDRSGDLAHNNSDALSYPVTVTGYKFTSGNKTVYTKTFLSKPV